MSVGSIKQSTLLGTSSVSWRLCFPQLLQFPCLWDTCVLVFIFWIGKLHEFGFWAVFALRFSVFYIVFSSLFRPVVAIFWARVVCSLALKDACFRMRITLGIVLICSLVCAIRVPGTSPERFRSGPELTGSLESRQDGIARLKCGFPS